MAQGTGQAAENPLLDRRCRRGGAVAGLWTKLCAAAPLQTAVEGRAAKISVCAAKNESPQTVEAAPAGLRLCAGDYGWIQEARPQREPGGYIYWWDARRAEA